MPKNIRSVRLKYRKADRKIESKDKHQVQDTEDDDRSRQKKKGTPKPPRKRKKLGKHGSSSRNISFQNEPKTKKSSISLQQYKTSQKKNEELCEVSHTEKHAIKNLDTRNHFDCSDLKQSKKKRFFKNQMKSADEVIAKPLVAEGDSNETKYSFQGILNQPISSFEHICKVSNGVTISNVSETQPNPGDNANQKMFIAELSNVNEERKNLIECDDTVDKLTFVPRQRTVDSESESQDATYESDSSNASSVSNIPQNGSNINNEPPWKREEDTVILETFQQEDDKDYALQIICDKLPNRTISQIRNRFSTLMAILIQTLKHRPFW